MHTEMAKEMIRLIRTEEKRRLDRLENQEALFEGQDFGSYEQWLFTDGPFINEMCLMVLVGLRHQVERELVSLAARVGARATCPECGQNAWVKIGPTITREQYQQNARNQREQLRQDPKDGWANLMARLNPKFSPEEHFMKTLRLLANCFKHAPDQDPDKKLLTHLGLPLIPPGLLVVGYMPLPQSIDFRKGLARSVNLPSDADYCTIADKFVDLADQYLEDVRKNANPARVISSFAEALA